MAILDSKMVVSESKAAVPESDYEAMTIAIAMAMTMAMAMDASTLEGTS